MNIITTSSINDNSLYKVLLSQIQAPEIHTHDLLRSNHLDLAGGAAHRRAASGAAETGRVADSVGVELLRAHEWHVKEGLRARVARHEHVVRDDAEPHLLAPLVGPHLQAGFGEA